MLTLHQYATLVAKLRAVQKANGVGYKTPDATTSATALEREVDAATAVALKPFPINILSTPSSK
jgi:hypothetical protein